MALPTPELTWDLTKVNQAIAATGTLLGTNRAINLAEKNAMKAFGSHPWTVTGSSDGVGGFGNNDNNDRWAAVGNLIWANSGTNHSWIVLKNDQIAAGNFLVCIDLGATSANGTSRNYVISPNAGFTGGTATARPTATDEQVIVATGAGWGLSGADAACKLHQYATSDGKQYRLVLYSGGAILAAIIIATPKNPKSGWTNPVFWWAKPGTAALDLNVLCTVGTAPMHARMNAADATLWMTVEHWGTTTLGGPARLVTSNPLDSSSYPLFYIGLASETGGAEGQQGQVYDLWWGLTLHGNADTYPNDATRLLCTHGDLVFPNPGGASILTS